MSDVVKRVIFLCAIICSLVFGVAARYQQYGLSFGCIIIGMLITGAAKMVLKNDGVAFFMCGVLSVVAIVIGYIL